MKIKNIYISNYKSFDASGVNISFNNITGFIGANSAGKTNVLKAIDLFFHDSKVEEYDFHNKDIEKDIIIDITFSGYGNIENVEETLLIDDNNDLRLRRVIRWKKEKGQAEYDKQLYPIKIWKYKGDMQELELYPEQRLNLTKVRNFNSSEKGEEFYSIANQGGNPAETVNDFYALLKQYWLRIYQNEETWIENYDYEEVKINDVPKDLTLFINNIIKDKLPEFIYLPIEQTISNELTYKRGTRLEYVFSKLLQYTEKEDARRKKNISDIQKKIEKYYISFYDKKIDNLNSNLNHPRVNWDFSNSKLSVCREKLNIDDVLNPSIKLMSNDGFNSEITTKGTGAQRLAVFQFLQTYADYICKSKDTNIILAIDEPELYLHPPYKRALYSLFRKLEKTFQTIYTTHEPIFVSLEYFDEIRIIRKNEEKNSYVNYVDWDKLNNFSSKVPEFKLSKSEKSKRQELCNKCHSDQNEGFFASKIILVEGNTEIYSLPIYFEELGFDINQQNISLIAGDGVDTLRILYAIFTLFGIPTYIIFDGDKPLLKEELDSFYKIYPMSSSKYEEILGLLKIYKNEEDGKIKTKLKRINKEYKIFDDEEVALFFDCPSESKNIVKLSGEKYREYRNKFSRNIKIQGLFTEASCNDGFADYGIFDRYTKWEYDFEEDVSKKLNNYAELYNSAKKDVSGKPLVAKMMALGAIKSGLSEEFKDIMCKLLNNIKALNTPGDIPVAIVNKTLKNKFKIVILPFNKSEEFMYMYQSEGIKYNIYSCAGGPLNPQVDEPIGIAYGIVPEKTKYIIKINGDSMEPDIPNGSYLAIDEVTEYINNKAYVFYHDGNSICKLYNKGDDGKVRLISLNPKIPVIEIGENEELICYGRVVCEKNRKPIFLDVVDSIETE